MSTENPALREIQASVTAYGEIESLTGDTITIDGTFYGGHAIPLHTGAKVYILTEDEALAWWASNDRCAGCEL